MTLAGLGFAFFLPVVWLIHWILPRRVVWQNLLLLLASYVFYASWNIKLLPLLWLSTLLDYGIGKGLSGQSNLQRRKQLLLCSIIANIGILAAFKYSGFFVESFNSLLGLVGISTSLAILKIALPLGISYITLLKIGYIIDVYYERISAEDSLLNFALFVAFFPHLIAGPIVRAREMLSQYAKPRILLPEHLQQGAGQFLLGFFMKAYVAEILARFYVTPVFKNPEAYSPLAHWMGLFAYAGQLFCDFAGYSLMAIGVAALFGLRLPDNFNYPFLSRGMMEFWRRWHITLNTWLFDYLYSPMTTGQGWMRGRLGLGFIITFVFSGLWHGPLWTFVLWGFLHGFGLLVQYRWDLYYKSLCRKDRKYVKLRKSIFYQTLAWLATQSFFLITLLPFRATSLQHTWTYAAGLFQSAGSKQPTLGFNLMVCVAFLLFYHLLALKSGIPWRERLFGLPAPVRGFAYGLVIVFLALFMPVGMGTFIYANF